MRDAEKLIKAVISQVPASAEVIINDLQKQISNLRYLAPEVKNYEGIRRLCEYLTYSPFFNPIQYDWQLKISDIITNKDNKYNF